MNVLFPSCCTSWSCCFSQKALDLPDMLFFCCCHFHNDVGSLSSLVFWMLMTHPVINPVWSCKYSVRSCHRGFLFWHILTPLCCLVLTFCRMGSRLPPPCPWQTRPRRCCRIWGRTPRRRGKRALARSRPNVPGALAYRAVFITWIKSQS